MQDNDHHMLHVSLLHTFEVCKDEKLMIWPALSPYLNPFENLWSILKKKIYSSGQRYMSKDDLWNGICDAKESIGTGEIQNLTKSVDGRLTELLPNKGSYVNE